MNLRVLFFVGGQSPASATIVLSGETLVVSLWEEIARITRTRVREATAEVEPDTSPNVRHRTDRKATRRYIAVLRSALLTLLTKIRWKGRLRYLNDD